MKTTFAIILLVICVNCMGQEIPDSTKNKIIIEYLASVQTQIKEARKVITIGDGESIVKNNNWAELLYLMLEDLKRRGK